MQILAGEFRSLRISTQSNLPYRPTKTRVRKSLFDSLMPFPYLNILDLFSGSGIIGFEAGSRGASSVTFVDQHKKTMELIRFNSCKLVGPSYSFILSDVFSFLRKAKSYDLIFADPPYGKYELEPMAMIILKHLNSKGRFILECDKSQEPFLDAKVSDYGETRILYWSN